MPLPCRRARTCRSNSALPDQEDAIPPSAWLMPAEGATQPRIGGKAGRGVGGEVVGGSVSESSSRVQGSRAASRTAGNNFEGPCPSKGPPCVHLSSQTCSLGSSSLSLVRSWTSVPY